MKNLSHQLTQSFAATNACFDPTKQASLKETLRRDWYRGTRNISMDSKHIDVWFDRLWDLHTEQSRFYHTVVHLIEMLQYLSQLREETHIISMTPEDEQTILLAIFFHDAIYDPKSTTNEQDSVQLFREFAQNAAISRGHDECSLAINVERFILATRDHFVNLSESNSPLAVFLDLDMAVLGKQSVAYRAYASLIRKEYSFVDHVTYCTKRAEVLEGFLKQERIYGTDAMRNAFEGQARQNLHDEVAALRQGVIYGTS